MGDGKQVLGEPRSASSESDVPETRSTPTAHPQLHTRQRVCKSSPYPLGMWREHGRSGRDRMSTGPNDALDIQGWKR